MALAVETELHKPSVPFPVQRDYTPEDGGPPGFSAALSNEKERRSTPSISNFRSLLSELLKRANISRPSTTEKQKTRLIEDKLWDVFVTVQANQQNVESEKGHSRSEAGVFSVDDLHTYLALLIRRQLLLADEIEAEEQQQTPDREWWKHGTFPSNDPATHQVSRSNRILQVLETIRQMAFPTGVLEYNAHIALNPAILSKPDNAVAYLQEIVASGIHPDHDTFMLLLQCLARQQRTPAASPVGGIGPTLTS
ncbi:hypothetical protein HK102_002846, partial [Quaeritorhiza haematococci]